MGAGGRECSEATVLGRKLDSGIFEEVVAEEKELTHDRGEDEFSGFAGGADAWPRESVPNFGQRARAVATVSASPASLPASS